MPRLSAQAISPFMPSEIRWPNTTTCVHMASSFFPKSSASALSPGTLSSSRYGRKACGATARHPNSRSAMTMYECALAALASIPARVGAESGEQT